MLLLDLPWDILYQIFNEPSIYAIGVRLNKEFHAELTLGVLNTIGRRPPARHEIYAYIKELWNVNRKPYLRIYFSSPRRSIYEEFLGGRFYSWTYLETTQRVDKLLDDGYLIDFCSYKEILSRRVSCVKMNSSYPQQETLKYIRKLFQADIVKRPEGLSHFLEMCHHAVNWHGDNYSQELLLIIQYTINLYLIKR